MRETDRQTDTDRYRHTQRQTCKHIYLRQQNNIGQRSTAVWIPRNNATISQCLHQMIQVLSFYGQLKLGFHMYACRHSMQHVARIQNVSAYESGLKFQGVASLQMCFS